MCYRLVKKFRFLSFIVPKPFEMKGLSGLRILFFHLLFPTICEYGHPEATGKKSRPRHCPYCKLCGQGWVQERSNLFLKNLTLCRLRL